MRDLSNASIKYATNHVINHIPSYIVRHAWYHHVLGWYVGPHVSILMGQYVQFMKARRDGKRVSIGAGTLIDHGCWLSTTGGLLIGERVTIAPGVWLMTGYHGLKGYDLNNDSQGSASYKPIIIDNDAWIGVRSIVLGGITIGRGAIVEAGAVVTQDVEPNAVVGGVPARRISTREELTKVSRIRKHRPLFE